MFVALEFLLLLVVMGWRERRHYRDRLRVAAIRRSYDKTTNSAHAGDGSATTSPIRSSGIPS